LETKRKKRDFIRHLYIRFMDDALMDLSAQLAFYLLLSLFPFLLFLLNLLGFTSISVSDLTLNLSRLIPNQAGAFLESVVREIAGARSTAVLSLSAVIAIWSASRGIGAISRGLNKAYDQTETRPFWKVAGISILFTLGMAVMVLSTLFFLIFGYVVTENVFSFLDGEKVYALLWSVLRFAVPIAIMGLVFTLIYIVMPNHRIRFKEALPGAIFTTLGWVVTSMLFSFYVNNFAGYTRIYGSIGGIIILLVWLQISSVIILLGGEINAVLNYFRSGKKLDKYENYKIKIPFWKGKKK